MILDLTQLKLGQKGKVVEIQGGGGLTRRLESMGIRKDKKITKIGAQFLRGPQTLRVDNLQVAIGFGMAKKIFIEVEQ
ncbi:MAG: FeoA family protein [Candidatus Omnitrophota bacterium]|jgi:ferrous iron transport protein A